MATFAGSAEASLPSSASTRMASMASPSFATSLLTVAFFVPLLSSPSSGAVAAAGGGSRGFSFELIHRDSPRSPFYNSSLTLPERVRAAFRRSSARMDYLQSFLQISSPLTEEKSVRRRNDSSSSFTSPVTADGFEYLMTISLGTPPADVLAILDTGSDLVWAKCRSSCRKCPGEFALISFDPAKSTSYRHLRCTSPLCSQLDDSSCGPRNLCRYRYSYVDSSFANGLLSRETFTFGSGRRGRVAVKRVAFGCADQVGGTLAGPVGGIVGLGRGPLSLVSQLGGSVEGKFSYCLASVFSNLNSTAAPGSRLEFGSTAVVTGDNVVTSPMVHDGHFYFLSLLNVTIGGARISAGTSPSSGMKMLIDSGTVQTTLPQSMYNRVKAALVRRIRLARARDPMEQFDLCYQVTKSTGPPAIPDVVLGFDGGKVELKSWNTFVPVGRDSGALMCLAIAPNGDGQMTTLGNMGQQNFHVGYDLVKKTISFAPRDCSAF